jgi:putative DNA primase/helicase
MVEEATMSVSEFLRANFIDVPTASGNYTTPCPQCSHDRKEAHQKLKCLSVKIDAEGVCWHCNHCGWSGGISGGKKFDAIYDYVDGDGALLWQKLRHQGAKRFTQRKPNGSGWQWSDVRKGQRSVLYRLPEVNEVVREGRLIVVVEGEKDADNLWAVGVAATCNPDGASEPMKLPKWTAEHSAQLRGADIVVLSDHDASGYAHQAATARLSYGVARRVRVLKLAEHWKECPEGGDISDWLKAGHSREDFDALLAKAADYVPESNGAGTPDDGGHHARQEDNWELVSVRMSAIEAKKTIWLWKWRIACGKLTIFAGLPDTNKSTIALDLAARITVGGPLPAGEGEAPLGSVIIFSAEDDAADTIKPRLEVAGGDPDRVHYVPMVREKSGKGQRGFDLTQDIERLERKIIEIGMSSWSSSIR